MQMMHSKLEITQTKATQHRHQCEARENPICSLFFILKFELLCYDEAFA